MRTVPMMVETSQRSWGFGQDASRAWSAQWGIMSQEIAAHVPSASFTVATCSYEPDETSGPGRTDVSPAATAEETDVWALASASSPMSEKRMLPEAESCAPRYAVESESGSR
ncbi:Uncharacterised protein [Collinsella aerofaciens]|uniref:Uncharacterized protein n=1 Tax=Collinsella aerofaciens TaxID=74426 RepID=A0A5K1JCQ6_9ACTN|nr:Uncharacterised protein [Collinsella aerofaciens]